MASQARAYYCIGGPLDGQWATSADFYGNWVYDDPSTHNGGHREEGMFGHLKKDYVQFNAGSRFNKSNTSMVWIHTSLLKPPIRASKR